MNFHLQNAINEFERAHKKFTRLSERENYPQDLELFARDLSKCLADMYKNDNGQPLRISSETNLVTLGGTNIKVKSDSNFKPRGELGTEFDNARANRQRVKSEQPNILSQWARRLGF